MAERERKRIRLDYAPLNVACALRVTTSGSPLIQTLDPEAGETVPDRGLVPTVIVPEVTADASDGSLSSPITNKSLDAAFTWYADGVDISTQKDWEGLYKVVTDESDERGTIYIYRNLSTTERITLRFEGTVNDPRRDVNVPVVSDEVILACLDAGEMGYSLSIEDASTIRYNPTRDALFEYEYAVAHGYEDEDASRRATVTDGKAYRRTIPLLFCLGKEVYDANWTVRLYRASFATDGTMSLSEITDTDDSEFEQIGTDGLTINLLMVDREVYIVAAEVAGEEVARALFGVKRQYPEFRVHTVNDASRRPTDTTRKDRLVVASRGRLLDYPESVYKLVWKCDTVKYTGVTLGEGSSVEYDISITGAGSTYDDGYIDQYVEAEQKDVFAVAEDEDGNTYVDENGLTYIFN